MIRLAAVLWAFALAAHAATLPATTVTLQTVLKAAQPGDTLALAPGAYGDVYLTRIASPAIAITSADPAHPASFRSLHIMGASGLHLDHIAVAFTPDAKTTSATPGLIISGASDISLTASKVIGGPSVNGVAASALVGDSTGDVIGFPAGYGVDVVQSQNISITGNEVAFFHRLVIFNNVSNATVSGNNLHDRRTTAISGAQVSDLTVDGNLISGATPWRWGDTPVGDHADCMAFWSNPTQTTPNARVKITNNKMLQTAGATIEGMWFQGGASSPFTDFEISGNVIVVPNLQGIVLSGSQGGLVANNTLIQANISGVDPKQRPTILLRAATTGVTVLNNQFSAPVSDLSGGVNPTSGTVLLTGVFEVPAVAGAPAAVTPDPRDAQVATLTASLASATSAQAADAAQVASLTQQLSDAKAAQTVNLAQVATLQGQLTTAQAALADAQKATSDIGAQLAADEARLTAVRAAIAP